MRKGASQFSSGSKLQEVQPRESLLSEDFSSDGSDVEDDEQTSAEFRYPPPNLVLSSEFSGDVQVRRRSIGRSPRAFLAATDEDIERFSKASKESSTPGLRTEDHAIIVAPAVLESAIKRVREELIKKYGSQKEAHAALDRNGDGVVSLPEFLVLMQDPVIQRNDVLNNVSLKRMFQELDVDGSGKLTVEEMFVNDIAQLEERAIENLRKMLLSKFKTKAGIIKAVDKNSDGRISFEELSGAFKHYDVNIEEATGGVSLARIFDLLDTDCSGSLDWEELLDSNPREACNERTRIINKFRELLIENFNTREELMKFMDKGNTGVLSYIDLRNGITRKSIDLREILGDKDFRWLFRLLDCDNSGTISAKELFECDPRQEISRLAAARRKRAQRHKKMRVDTGSPKCLTSRRRGGNSPETCQKLEEENKQLARELSALRQQQEELMILVGGVDLDLVEQEGDTLEDFGEVQEEGSNSNVVVMNISPRNSRVDYIVREVATLKRKSIMNKELNKELTSKVNELLEQINGQTALTQEEAEFQESQRLRLDDCGRCRHENEVLKQTLETLKEEHERTVSNFAQQTKDYESELEICRVRHSKDIHDLHVLQEKYSKLSLEYAKLIASKRKLEVELERIRESQAAVTELQDAFASLTQAHEASKKELLELEDKHQKLRVTMKKGWDSDMPPTSAAVSYSTQLRPLDGQPANEQRKSNSPQIESNSPCARNSQQRIRNVAQDVQPNIVVQDFSSPLRRPSSSGAILGRTSYPQTLSWGVSQAFPEEDTDLEAAFHEKLSHQSSGLGSKNRIARLKGQLLYCDEMSNTPCRLLSRHQLESLQLRPSSTGILHKLSSTM